MPEPVDVLFVCTQNAGRSQIAEALFERHARGGHQDHEGHVFGARGHDGSDEAALAVPEHTKPACVDLRPRAEIRQAGANVLGEVRARGGRVAAGG